MDSLFLVHSITIIISSLVPFIWIQNSSTAPYTLQLCGALVMLYIVFRKILGKTYHENTQSVLTILTLNSITQLLIISTGGATSPLFFLYYFLIFAFSLVYESFQGLTLSLITVSLFWFYYHQNLSPQLVANLFSLLLIFPLSQSFSTSLLKNLESKGKIKLLEKTIEREETDSLLWINTEAKPTLNSVIDRVTDLIIFLKSTRSDLRVPKNFFEKIKSIQADLLTLYSSSENLEEVIKEESDNKII